MEKDLFRHNLLKLLTEKYIYPTDKNDLGFTYKYLESKFKINKKELFTLIAELFSAKEIQLYNPTGDSEELGICATNEGVSSFSSEKYKNRHFSLKRALIKDYVQIIIPILSLCIAFVAICIKIETFDNNQKQSIKKLEQEIKQIRNSLKK